MCRRPSWNYSVVRLTAMAIQRFSPKRKPRTMNRGNCRMPDVARRLKRCWRVKHTITWRLLPGIISVRYIKPLKPPLRIVSSFTCWIEALTIRLCLTIGDYFVIRMRKRGKDEAGEKLIIKDLEAEMVKVYDKVVFKEKTYLQAQGRFEWGEWKGYGITRVGFSSQSGAAIFREPLLLVSNLEIKAMLMARS